MTLSARNHLPGIVEEITLGGVMAHVVVRLGSNVVESVIHAQERRGDEAEEGRHGHRHHQVHGSHAAERLSPRLALRNWTPCKLRDI
jgi:molybdopterin-binding protein